MSILLVLGKNIETTKTTKLNAEKLPILPKPPKSFTQPHIKKRNHTCANLLSSSMEPIKSLNEETLMWCNNKNSETVVASTSMNNAEQFKSSNLFFSSDNDDSPIKKTDDQITSPTQSTNSIDFFRKEIDGKTTKKRKNIVTFDVSPSISTNSIDLFPDEGDGTIKKKITKQAVFPAHLSPTSSVEAEYNETPNKVKEQFNIEGALKFLIKSQVQMAQKFEIIENNQKQILFLVNKNMTDAPADKNWNIEFSTTFPLQDIQSLNEIEQRLITDIEFKEKLANRISSFRGLDDSTFIKSSLDNIFSDKIGVLISFTGRKPSNTVEKKYAMKSSLLYKLICDVGRSRYKNFSDEKAEKVTSSWLRHSIDRLKRTAALT
ncbi:uncharacterized protein LOC107884659 isoform X1 [Acyrthosiphon pisum]|uniref:DUF4806 domain-containing protein n=2 Tax=Acyrthosiphon pisum TaxID=7029 RepID=A0A8R2JWA5_ACYPI|nr:uncharacterized protein LOC107884659 isoform X1 [Acyrthosiphon pisum]